MAQVLVHGAHVSRRMGLFWAGVPEPGFQAGLGPDSTGMESPLTDREEFGHEWLPKYSQAELAAEQNRIAERAAAASTCCGTPGQQREAESGA